MLACVQHAQADDLGLSLGLVAKAGAGANYLPAPSGTPMIAGPFDDGVGGYGIAGGLAVDARLFKGLLGVESGLIIDAVTDWSKYEPAGNAGPELSLGWSTTELRIPLLVSVGTPGDGTRLSFGTGPEFVVPLSATYEIEVERGVFGSGYNFDAESETHVNWLVNLGIASPLGPLRATFDVRFAYNLGVPDTYAERLNGGQVKTLHAMDLRLLVGLGYDLL